MKSRHHQPASLAIFSSFLMLLMRFWKRDELLEEVNAFEAEAVQDVEDAKPSDLSEVTTREVPEDDVPAEYLNNDNDKDVA